MMIVARVAPTHEGKVQLDHDAEVSVQQAREQLEGKPLMLSTSGLNVGIIQRIWSKEGWLMMEAKVDGAIPW